MDKRRGEREDGEPSKEERQRGAHLESEDVYRLKRLADSAPALIRLADHADSIIADAKNREWWVGFQKRVRVVAGYVSIGIASVAATIAWVQSNKGKWPWW